MELYLYKKNVPVLIFEEDDSHSIITVKRVLNTQSLPVHLYKNAACDDSDLYYLTEALKDFLNNRMIPYNRKYFKNVLSELNLESGYALAKKSHFLSLSDQYWILSAEEIGKLWWEDLNFFTNEYDSEIGLRLVNNSSSLNKNTNSHTPDNTTAGELPKRWVRKDGINFLEKAGTGTEQLEPVNEVLASEICRRLKINYVPYELVVRDDIYYSLCPDIVDENREMVPFESVYKGIVVEENGCYNFEKLCKRCDLFGIPDARIDLLKIYLLDFIIANTDRHTYNISFLRETDSGKWIGVSPVYDSGKSMFLNMMDFEIKMESSYRIPAKPFAETQIQQFEMLPFELLYGKIDLSALDGIEKWYKKILLPLKRISKNKKEALVQILLERIEETKTLLNKKFEESGVIFLKNKSVSSIQLVFDSLVKNPNQTKEELEKTTMLSRATITRCLSVLIDDKKIRRIGANKNGYWEILV